MSWPCNGCSVRDDPRPDADRVDDSRQRVASFKAPNWLNHLDYEWRSSAWGPLPRRACTQSQAYPLRLTRQRVVVFGTPPEISVEAMLTDTQAVVTAAGLDKFALLGISQGMCVLIRHAVEHPEQVRCLVLYGGYLRGRLRRSGPEQKQLFEVEPRRLETAGAPPTPYFGISLRQPSYLMLRQRVANSFDELQRVATSTENALRIWEMNAQVDVTELAKRFQCQHWFCTATGIALPIRRGRQVAKMIPSHNSSSFQATTTCCLQAPQLWTSSSTICPHFSQTTPAHRCRRIPILAARAKPLSAASPRGCGHRGTDRGLFPDPISRYPSQDCGFGNVADRAAFGVMAEAAVLARQQQSRCEAQGGRDGPVEKPPISMPTSGAVRIKGGAGVRTRRRQLGLPSRQAIRMRRVTCPLLSQ